MKGTVVGWSIFLLPLAALVLLGFGAAAAGVAGVVWLAAVAQSVIPLAFHAEEPVRAYHLAIAKMHRDKYQEAEEAVLEELEKEENDFNGWFLLAELYANHFGDLAGAGLHHPRNLRSTCTNASQVCLAFNHLADWQLALAADPAAARQALEEICRRYPGHPHGPDGPARIHQFPPAAKKSSPGGRQNRSACPPWATASTRPPSPRPRLPTEKQAARANDCVQKLQKNPDNMAVARRTGPDYWRNAWIRPARPSSRWNCF